MKELPRIAQSTPISISQSVKSVKSVAKTIFPMSDIAIHVEKLSKHYRIGAAQERHDTTSAMFNASLCDTVSALFGRTSQQGCMPGLAVVAHLEWRSCFQDGKQVEYNQGNRQSTLLQ